MLQRIFPPPRRYHLAWSNPNARKPIYVWEAIPPTDDYICLGCVATTGPDPPDREEVRCVPKSWCKETTVAPSALWSDAEVGGNPGGIWAVNALGLLGFSPNANPPVGPFFDFRTQINAKHSCPMYEIDEGILSLRFRVQGR